MYVYVGLCVRVKRKRGILYVYVGMFLSFPLLTPAQSELTDGVSLVKDISHVEVWMCCRLNCKLVVEN